MLSLRQIFYKPKVDDWSPLAKFYYADDALNTVAAELDSFDGRRDPDRCNQLVNRLRHCQDKVLQIIEEMLCTLLPGEDDRAPRDYRVKFPDDILHENLPGQLWFGAECLAAGSNIIDHEFESEAIRPLARALTRNLDTLREQLKEQSLKNPNTYPEKLKRQLQKFDHLLAEFELNYVSAMVPVKSVREYDVQLDVAVMFSESLLRAKNLGYLTEDQIEDCDPSVMITLPRMAILCGLHIFLDGPLNLDVKTELLCEIFRPFHTLLKKIRDLLRILTDEELVKLERALCSGEAPRIDDSVTLISDYRSNRPKTTPIPCASVQEEQVVDSLSTDLAVPQVQGSPSSIDNELEETGSATDSKQPDVTIEVRSEGVQHTQITVTKLQQNDTSASKAVSIRSRFRSSDDLVHRLFVCIAGVADQLQTNYPSDLRAVLKMVLQPNDVLQVFEVSGQTAQNTGNEEETGIEVNEDLPSPSANGIRWVPDSECPLCSSCQTVFSFTRRRHHCRNCGKIYCSRCSVNSVSLPGLGYKAAVRVCNQCFLYKLNPFTPQSHQETNQDQQPSATGTIQTASSLLT